MDEDYIHEQHAVHHMLYHILFCPNRRKKVLVGPVHDRLQEIIEQVAREHSWTIVQGEVSRVQDLVGQEPHD